MTIKRQDQAEYRAEQEAITRKVIPNIRVWRSITLT